MAIFLDSGKLDQVKKFMRWGVIRGVTTNPTILFKDGVTGGVEGMKARAREIANMIAPLPLSLEVTSNDPAHMIAQAREFASLAENINIKITIHGPEGETDNIEAIHELETVHNVRVNATAMMSAQQCLLAALAGATYVSLFGGRVNNMGYDASDEIQRLREVLELQGLPSQIIIGSVREINNVIAWLHAGAHIVTVTPDILAGMLVHPYSKETVKMFLDDAKKCEAC
ncbi:MAG: transaldolase family protein [Thermodesulfobacteriota bacterium]